MNPYSPGPYKYLPHRSNPEDWFPYMCRRIRRSRSDPDKYWPHRNNQESLFPRICYRMNPYSPGPYKYLEHTKNNWEALSPSMFLRIRRNKSDPDR